MSAEPVDVVAIVQTVTRAYAADRDAIRRERQRLAALREAVARGVVVDLGFRLPGATPHLHLVVTPNGALPPAGRPLPGTYGSTETYPPAMDRLSEMLGTPLSALVGAWLDEQDKALATRAAEFAKRSLHDEITAALADMSAHLPGASP